MPRILFVGDVVGEPGRRTLRELLPKLRERHAPDFVVVNGENAAGGMGITERNARAMLDNDGVDVITLGNHAYRHRDVYMFLDSDARIVRPANHHPSSPGRGVTVIERESMKLAVVNLSGSMTLTVDRNPFDAVEHVLDGLPKGTDLILVDFHAEATSEKVAMGLFLDGRVTAVVGTHTHVPTADARVLPGGTAFISDAGMTGSRAGVIGVRADLIISRLRTGLPVKFESATGDEHLMGVLIETGAGGRATAVEQLIEPLGD